MARKTPEINAGSMADIAFLLLIFFLVTTTMNVDRGLFRILPPLVDKQDDDGIKVRQRNVLSIRVAGDDRIMAKGEVVLLYDLKDIVKEFLLNVNNSEDLPEKEKTNIPIIGEFMVSKGIVSLQNDRQTSYKAYLEVQNELTKALNEIKDEYAQAKFDRPFAELAPEQQEAINKAFPTKISEADPVDYTK